MKNLNTAFLTAFLIAFSVLSNAQSDTITVKDNETKIIKPEKTESGKYDTTRISLNKTKILIITSEDYTMSEKDNKKTEKKHKNDYVWAAFQLGINGFLTPDYALTPDQPYEFMELRAANSIGVQINFLEKRIPIYKNRVGLITGLGVEWNNYKFAQNITFARSSDFPDLQPFTPIFGYEDPRTYRKSKLTTSNLNLPLLLSFSSNKNKNDDQFNLSFGVIGTLRYITHTKQVFEGEKSRIKDKDRGDFGINPFALQGTVRVRYGWFSIFANYSLTEFFRQDKGPEIYPFSVGLSLINF